MRPSVSGLRRRRKAICGSTRFWMRPAKHGADAIHPGYGFLSENAEFAEACAAAGFVFIGPPAESIRRMGSKTAPRDAWRSQPERRWFPEREEAATDVVSARSFRRALGYPVLLKAVGRRRRKRNAPGGSEDDLESALRDASSEAERAFPTAKIYIEKLVEEPRHIEIQIRATSMAT